MIPSSVGYSLHVTAKGVAMTTVLHTEVGGKKNLSVNEYLVRIVYQVVNSSGYLYTAEQTKQNPSKWGRNPLIIHSLHK